MPEAESTGRAGSVFGGGGWGGGTQCNLGGALLNPEHIWRKLAWMGRGLEFMGQGWCTGAVNGRSTGGWEREQGEPDRLQSRGCTDQGEQLPQGDPTTTRERAVHVLPHSPAPRCLPSGSWGGRFPQ